MCNRNKINSSYALNSFDAIIDNNMTNVKLNVNDITISFPDNFEFKMEDFLFHLIFTIANHQNLLNYNSSDAIHPL